MEILKKRMTFFSLCLKRKNIDVPLHCFMGIVKFVVQRSFSVVTYTQQPELQYRIEVDHISEILPHLYHVYSDPYGSILSIYCTYNKPNNNNISVHLSQNTNGGTIVERACFSSIFHFDTYIWVSKNLIIIEESPTLYMGRKGTKSIECKFYKCGIIRCKSFFNYYEGHFNTILWDSEIYPDGSINQDLVQDDFLEFLPKFKKEYLPYAEKFKILCENFHDPFPQIQALEKIVQFEL